MATTTRQLTGRTHRIVAASIIEAHLDLDFGVKVLKRLHITSAPPVCRLDFERALHATIILCGGKRLFVELDTTQRDFDVQATVRVKRCQVPLRWRFGDSDDSHLDVGCLLRRVLSTESESAPTSALSCSTPTPPTARIRVATTVEAFTSSGEQW
ncbi:MAG: hypothetical protein KF787_10995 [Phycisphaeraceae bacterium]|nr:hypothetical protein [Phycisphaerae bacterium]MBX3393162.1 hypothetical protein [Phycisphaeraceae bacterium]